MISLFNNIALSSISICFILNHFPSLELNKVMLIMPFITHKDLLQYISNANADFKSIEELIAKKPTCFSNFNQRFYDTLPLTVNSIQFLHDMQMIVFSDGLVSLLNPIEYELGMGKRLHKINKASEKLAKILAVNPTDLYLNLRVQI